MSLTKRMQNGNAYFPLRISPSEKKENKCGCGAPLFLAMAL